MALVVRGGTVVSGGRSQRADVLVEGGTVVAVGEVGAPGAADVDAGGCFVLPGGVDPHTHVFGAVESDTVSALCGGTTTLVSFADEPAEPGETPADAVRRLLADEVPRSAVDIGIHAVVWEPEAYRPGDLAAAAELGVTSVKLWLAYRDLGIQIGDERAYAVMREAAREGVLVLAHCENGDLAEALKEEHRREGRVSLRYHAQARPVALEREAVHRFLAIAGLAGAEAYVVHVTAPAPLAEIEAARARGQRVHAEVCTTHLVYTDAVYEGPDPLRFVLTPPLRTQSERDALWESLAAGSLEVLASDHSHVPLVPDKVEAGDDFTKVPYGVSGVEARLALAWSLGVERGLLTPERLVEVACEAPARIFGLAPRKGSIRPGADADLVVWDPAVRWTIGVDTLHDGVDHTPFEGMAVQGRPRFVVAGGEVAVAEGRYLGRSRPARFLSRPRLGGR